jgi:hypothetical protein
VEYIPKLHYTMEDRLPNEVRSMHKKQGRNRLLQHDAVHQIADKMSAHIERPLDQIELRALISHIKRLDGNKFRTMDLDEATTQVAEGYLAFMSSNDHAIYDTHEIMKQYLGGGVKVSPDRFMIKKECGTSNGTPSDQSSVQKAGGHMNAYAMFPQLEGFKEGVENKSEERQVARTVDTDHHLQDHLKKKYNEDDDVPVYGEWLRKNNTIVPRERSIYVLLDSRYRNRSTSPDVFQWTVSSVPSDSRGIVSAMTSMQNIIYMQFSSFYIPYTSAADNVYRKVSLLVDELQFAAVMAHENRHYHAMFDTEVQGNRILCTPDTTDDGRFRFNTPINYIKSISVSFGGPLNQLSFLSDYFTVVISVNAPNSTYLTFSVDHNVSDGEVVYIDGFATATPQVDFAAVSAISDELGHTVSVVNNVTLEINADLSTTTMLTPNPSVECYITTRRVFIPIRFVYLT